MQQVYRRQLLALGRLGGDEELLDAQCQRFIRTALAARLNTRPHTEAVLDVLLSSGASSAVAARFVGAFDEAVWRGPAHHAVTGRNT